MNPDQNQPLQPQQPLQPPTTPQYPPAQPVQPAPAPLAAPVSQPQPDRIADLAARATISVQTPPPKKPFNKRLLILIVAVVVVVTGLVVGGVLLMKNSKPSPAAPSADNKSSQVDYSGLAPADIFNTLISNFKSDAAVVAGPLNKGVDAGGDKLQNLTVIYEPATDTSLLMPSTYGGVDFTVADAGGAKQSCKERLDKLTARRDTLVQALTGAGYTAQKTVFHDTTTGGGPVCIEVTSYFHDASKIYCSEERSTTEKALAFSIACTDEKRAASNMALAKEVVPVLKAAKVAFEPFVLIGGVQQSTVQGYEWTDAYTRPSVLGGAGLYRKSGGAWKVLPGGALSSLLDCSTVGRDPDIAKAYAEEECYDGAQQKYRPIGN